MPTVPVPPELETSLIDSLANTIGTSVFDSVLEVLDGPVMGWLTTFLGGGGDQSNQQYQTILQDLSQIQTDINNLENDLTLLIQNTTATGLLLPAVTYIKQKWADFPPVPGDIVEEDDGYLESINSTQVGDQPGETAYITTFISANVPRFYSDNPPLVAGTTTPQQVIMTQFVYYQKWQFMMMQMLVDACHEGEGQQVELPPSAPVAPNYVSAAAYVSQYFNQIQQQQSFVPFSTAGLGFNLPLNPLLPTFAGQIVVDRNPLQVTNPSPSAQPFAWGYMNVLSILGDGIGTIEFIQAALANAWMVRLPTMAELESLNGFLSYDGGNPTGQKYGFNVTIQLGTDDRPTVMCFPFMSQEALDVNNWHVFSDNENVPRGYECRYFYDINAGHHTLVRLWCENVTEPLNDANAFADIANGLTNAEWMMDPGIGGTPQQFNPGTSLYCDALFIYEFWTNGTTYTDPPVEEPSTLTILLSGQDDSSATFTASGTFTRLTISGATAVVQLPLTANVFWQCDTTDSTIATISNAPDSIGVLTWGSAATPSTTVNVTAYRGTLASASVAVSPLVASPVPGPTLVNIYPRTASVTAPSPTAVVDFNIQILYSDGSVSSATAPPNSQCTWVPSNPAAAVAESGSPQNFTIVGGTRTGQVTITATLTGTSLQDAAVISVPVVATYDDALPTLAAVTQWFTNLYTDLAVTPAAGEIAQQLAAYQEAVANVQTDLSVYRASLVKTLLFSSEYALSAATALYAYLLNAQPSSSDIALYVQDLESGTSLQDITADLCGGATFLQNNPVPGAFVQALYMALLHRAPNAQEDQGWINGLNNGTLTPGQICSDFVVGDEYCTDQVNGLYKTFLARTPNATEAAGFIQEMQNGTSMQALFLTFATSPEYFADCG